MRVAICSWVAIGVLGLKQCVLLTKPVLISCFIFTNRQAKAKYKCQALTSFHEKNTFWKSTKFMDANNSELSHWTYRHSPESIWQPEFSVSTQVIMPMAKATHNTRTEQVFLLRFYHFLEGTNIIFIAQLRARF